MATGFANKYRFDPFFRTEFNIIALQIAFSLFIFFLVGVAFNYLYGDVSSALISAIQHNIATQASPEGGAAIAREIEGIRERNLAIVAAVLVLTTIVLGYAIASLALQPTRNALASQKRFIGNIAHEIRTPLSVIKTSTEVALFDPDLSDEMRRTLTGIVQELDRASSIINNLLSLSASIRPENIEFSVVDAARIAEESVHTMRPLAERRGVDVIYRKAGECALWGNETGIEQIATNLIKNAIEHTPRGGRVTVTVERIGLTHVELAVTDTGEGISREDLFHIFEPFYRAEQSRSRAKGGSGLGLTIVSELVKIHHGKIMVRSALGRGTTAVVSFPVGGARAPSPPEGGARAVPLDEIAVDFSDRL